MTETFAVSAIGRVRCGRTEAIDDAWDSWPSVVQLDETLFGPDALAGLDGYSHVEVIYVFDKVAEGDIVLGARHPRGRTDWPRVGIFAQRGKNRPNRIGATICRVVSVDGTRLHVSGLDAIDGTPVLDIKPVMTGFLPRGEVREPEWAQEIMRAYW